jgi:excisionase family DNA binding protein
MKHQPQQLKQALKNLRQALEETESALLELEGSFLEGEEQVRPEERRGQDLLSVAEVCQELGMGKSWVHYRLKSGEIPNIRLGNNIKVRRKDLQEYLESKRYHPPAEEEEELASEG